MYIKGVDISEHDGNVDYNYLASQGVEFCIVRFGFGTKRADYYYQQNVENALASGLNVGAYWFIYALDESSARANAEMFCELLEPYKGRLTYPIFADFEYDSEDYMIKNGVTPNVELNTAIVKAFCEVVASHGWYVGNYANPDYIYNHFDNSQLEQYDLWLAHWGVSEPEFTCPLWQYGDEWGHDANICFVDYPAIIRAAGKNGLGEAPQPIANTVSQREVFAEIFEHMCTHDGDGGHGYSQYARWGDGSYESVLLPCGLTVAVPNGDFDCSSGILTALEQAGVNTGAATYTGNMREELMKTGLFEWWPVDTPGYAATRGDIYLNEQYHTAMCVSQYPDMLAQFSIAEDGSSIHGKQGDQTGMESNIMPYYNNPIHPWDGKLHWISDGTIIYLNKEEEQKEEETYSDLDRKTNDDLALEVLEGKYGNGEERKKALGDRYEAVQAIVNALLEEEEEEEESSPVVDIDDLAHRVLKGEFGVGEERKEKLGELYDAVQARVNEILLIEVNEGTYECVVGGLNVRDAPNLRGHIVAEYHRGQTVVLEEWSACADGFIWGRYIGANSGLYRYIAVRRTDGTELLTQV